MLSDYLDSHVEPLSCDPSNSADLLSLSLKSPLDGTFSDDSGISAMGDDIETSLPLYSNVFMGDVIDIH